MLYKLGELHNRFVVDALVTDSDGKKPRELTREEAHTITECANWFWIEAHHCCFPLKIERTNGDEKKLAIYPREGQIMMSKRVTRLSAGEFQVDIYRDSKSDT